MPETAKLLEDLTSEDTDRAEAAAIALANEQNAIAELAAMCQNASPNTRWWAIRTLSGFDDPIAQDCFIRALGDSEPAVRQCAALALAKHPTPAAIDALIPLLAETDQLLARLSADALVAVGNDAVPALIAAVDQKTAGAQAEAVRALALIGDTRAIPTLFNLLDSQSAVLEHWASQGLEKMGVGMSFFSV